MIEIGGLLWLVGGFGSLLATGGLIACCLRIRSPIEFLLAGYVIAWSWLVAVMLLLSPIHLVTRGWIVAVLSAGVLAALAVWATLGKPGPPSMRSVRDGLREALRHPAVVVLAVGVAVGTIYSLALALLTPVNEGDALAYHLARAAFWHQEHGLGYVAGAEDPRLDVNPPNAEIGQLLTMVLSSSDRYVALPQLGGYAALVLCVAGLGRRIGIDGPGALFGALAFATLPIVALQASGALNDLVVASFLACAALFALRPGRARLALVALAVGLALGAKLSALLAFPTLALVVAVARPARSWPGIALAGAAGIALGSTWYVVNLVETGELDGGLARIAEQGANHAPAAVATTALRLTLDAIDMSGASERHATLFLGAAAVLALLGLIRRFRPHRREFFAAAALTASVMLLFPLAALGEQAVETAWELMERPETPAFADAGRIPNVDADTTQSWYGPLGTLLLFLGPVGVVVHRTRRTVPRSAIALSLAPWVMLVTLAVTLIWDPYRGRFLAFGVALAAATWGIWLRRPGVAVAMSTIGVVALFLTLNFHLGKPSGLGELWPRGSSYSWREGSTWTDTRPQAQTRLRPGSDEIGVLELFDSRVPADAIVAVAPRDNDFLSPYFGSRLSRHVTLLRPGDTVPADVEWLVLSPATGAADCGGVFAPASSDDSGWRVERRLTPGRCRVAAST